MANPKLSTLADQFSGATLNAAVWNNSSGLPNVSLDTVLDRVQINCTSGYPAFGGAGPWDLTGDAIYARVSPAPIGTGTTQTIMRVTVDANNRASLFTDGGGILTAAVVNAGASTQTVIGAYDGYSHAWWRIREAGGNVFFETAPDGWTWTTRATIAHTWSAAAVSVVWICGYFGTEAAGMAAYIDHVNTTTSAPGQPNLNWPLIEDGWGPIWNAGGGGMPLDRFVEVTDRTRGTVSVSRGRQYELDQVRSGEASMRLANTDAALDPVNASGPWAGHITPYQPYRRRAQWPPTRNLLDQAQATGGDMGGYPAGPMPGATDVFSDTDVGDGSIVASATAWQGANVFQFSVPNASAINQRVFHTPRFSVIPGQQYTVQVRVRNITAATSLSVKPHLGWYTASAGAGGSPASFTYGSTSILTGSATAAWTTVTVTGTAPASAAAMDVGVSLAVAAAATCSVQADGWQLEKGATATTWQAPGVWNPIYAGFMERWSSKWDMSGTYGVVEPSAVDAFSLLSQKQLDDPLTQEINNNNPRFLFKLDDPAGSTSVSDAMGNFPAAQLAVSKYGAGSLIFGTAITSTDSGGTYTGSTGTVATLNNPNPGAATPSAATFIKLTAAGIVGPADATSWTRMIAFRYTGPTPSNGAYLWSSMDGQRSGGNQSGSFIRVLLGSDGKPTFQLQGPSGAGTSLAFGGATNCVDGDWHLLIFGYNQATQQIVVSQDGTTAAFYGGIPNTYAPTGTISDCVGAYVDATVGNGVVDNFKGDISFVCEFSWSAATQTANLYSAWKSACAGESSNARYSRILRYAGYTGSSSVQTGLTTSMGPASLDGQDAVSALQAVVDTEGGAHYVARDGKVTFKSRSARYNATIPMYVFGENTAAGEWPYEDCELDYDSTHLSNQVTVTQGGAGQLFYAQDAASITAYFPRSMSRTINSNSGNECQDAANYLLSRYRQPATRVSSIKLHPSANPALWPVCLALELGTRVRVMRRAPGVPATQVEAFVENIQWDFGDDGDALVTLQCSPADLTPYGIFAAWHTTLATSPGAGATTVTVNASQDNTNPLAAQLASGQSLVLGQNTANQETVTVLSVAATSPGWTTAVLTLTAATTKAHTSGDLVNEPLPAGVTDPTTWDATSKFDVAAFAY